MNLDELERIAKAAQERSPGPWRRLDWYTPVESDDAEFDWIMDSAPRPDYLDEEEPWHGNRVLETDSGYYEPKGATGAHIAAFSPDVVLKLIARVRAAEGERPTQPEIDALREFAHESRHGMQCQGDAPIPLPEALRAIDKLVGRVRDPGCRDCQREEKPPP